ncbi:unnamed protein product [Arctogadus glacialis]
MLELLARAEERTPYQVVALQECERMNFLTQEMRRTLHELGLGLKVSPATGSSHTSVSRTLRRLFGLGNEWPLDRMCLQCDVTKKNREDFTSPPREGAYVHGLFMEGARWDTQLEAAKRCPLVRS